MLCTFTEATTEYIACESILRSSYHMMNQLSLTLFYYTAKNAFLSAI